MRSSFAVKIYLVSIETCRAIALFQYALKPSSSLLKQQSISHMYMYTVYTKGSKHIPFAMTKITQVYGPS